MEALHCQDDLRQIKPRSIFTHEHRLPNLPDQLAARQIVQEHVKVVLVLETFVNIAAEVALDEPFQNIPLI